MRHWWAFVTNIYSTSTFHPSQTGMASNLVNVWRQWVGEQQQGARVVSGLANPVYGSGRNITTDSFFTSHALAKFLLRQNLTLLGTVRRTRKELPSEFVLKKHTAFESAFAFTEDTTSRTPQRQTRLLYSRRGPLRTPSPDRGHGGKGPHYGLKGALKEPYRYSGRPYRLAYRKDQTWKSNVKGP